MNCELLTEGFDEPGVDCILMARPTRSEGLYTQVWGEDEATLPTKEMISTGSNPDVMS